MAYGARRKLRRIDNRPTHLQLISEVYISTFVANDTSNYDIEHRVVAVT